jgi:hypothetical protein
MPRANVFFISETAPVNTHASSVIFYRHLQKLSEDGYRVVWVTDKNSYGSKKGSVAQWETIILPNRKWHLPPYRGKGLAQWYRFAYYYRRYLEAAIQDGPAVLLTHISGQFLAPFAAFVQKRSQLPLVSFFHDDILELNFYRNKKILIRNTEAILNASSVVLTVSKAFAKNWPRYAPKFSILYPVPDIHKVSRVLKLENDTVTIGYAGAIYDELIPYFEALLIHLKGTKIKLVIVGDRKKTNPLLERYAETLTCIELFPTPAEASQFLVDHCEAMIIPYPATIAEMPWMATCYPSKFIQYCQIGLPTIIIAPQASAIGKWCIDHQWKLYSENYDLESLNKLLNEITSEAVKAQLAMLNAGLFRPGRITQQFENILHEIVKQSS